MTAETIYFIHVPKTGGTSFRRAAIATLGEDAVLSLYRRSNPTTTASARAAFWDHPERPEAERLAAVSAIIAAGGIRLVSSHLWTPRLPSFRPEQAAVILREPVARVLSHHRVAGLAEEGRGAEPLPLEAFIEEETNRDVQLRALAGADIGAIAVVGLTERYPAFVERLGERLGLAIPVRHHNRAGWLSRLKRRGVPRRLTRRIEALNAKDMELYEKARTIAA